MTTRKKKTDPFSDIEKPHPGTQTGAPKGVAAGERYPPQALAALDR